MTTETKATSLQDAIEDIPAGLWCCDMNGHPSTDYIPRWKALDIAIAHDKVVAQLVDALERVVEEFGELPGMVNDERAALAKARAALLSHKGER